MKQFLKTMPLLACLFAFAACEDDGTPGSVDETGHWQISAQYVSDTMMLNNDVLNEGIANGQFIPQGAEDLPPEVFARYKQMARRMMLVPLPAIYLDNADTRQLPQAAARFTHQGKPYILINRDALARWSPRQFVAVLGHELVHLKERHVTAERLAEAYNHPDVSVAHEFEADKVGSGPLGSCDPAALEQALTIVIGTDQRDYLDKNPFKTTGDYDDLATNDHPSWLARKAALDEMIANPPAACARHTPVS